MNRPPHAFFLRSLPGWVCGFVFGFASSLQPIHAAYKDDIGFSALQTELGVLTPNGNGITALHVEAPAGGNYLPNTGHAQFSGKTFYTLSAPSGTSSHATTVGQYFYGNSTSIAPGIQEVGLLNANDYLNGVLAYGGGTNAPLISSFYRVQNHSWVGDAGANNAIVLNRLDFAIARDNVVSVVGVNNGGTSRQLLANSYNTISVGVTDGDHPTVASGIQRPDLVAPSAETSYATPMVSAAAALLLDAGTTANSQRNVVVKSLLMTGATKSEFTGWSRTETRPIDNQFGAGELNIYNSYHTLAAGEQTASLSSPVSATGWDFSSISAGADAYYYFDVSGSGEFTATLNWNAVYTPTGGNYDAMTLNLANLDLTLYSVTGLGFSLSSLLQQSISTNQSFEHLWFTGLSTGRYALKVGGVSGDTDYALSWRTNILMADPVPEPSASWLLFFALGYLVIRSRRMFSHRVAQASCLR